MPRILFDFDKQLADKEVMDSIIRQLIKLSLSTEKKEKKDLESEMKTYLSDADKKEKFYSYLTTQSAYPQLVKCELFPYRLVIEFSTIVDQSISILD